MASKIVEQIFSSEKHSNSLYFNNTEPTMQEMVGISELQNLLFLNWHCELKRELK